MSKITIVNIIGTRPEAIKMAPVIARQKSEPWCNCIVVATGQHRELLDQVLQIFDIAPDLDLNLMEPNQSLADLTARLFSGLDKVVKKFEPTAILAQGDTTSVFVAAMVAFYNNISFGHVEAGLRTGDLRNPFPEEMNRALVGRLARWHFSPTASTKQNLIKEGVPESQIWVTGNTVIDALKDALIRSGTLFTNPQSDRRRILVTAHRRENFGAPMQSIFTAFRHLADTRNDIEFLFPVHPNPNVRKMAYDILGNHPRIQLCEPLGYLPFIAAMKESYFIVSDSGGVQEEAPSLGKPVLVLRDETERGEAVTDGCVRLVGTNFDKIVYEVNRLLDTPGEYDSMVCKKSPFGDGFAAERIMTIIKRDLVNLGQSLG